MAMPVTLKGTDLAGQGYEEATQTVVINRTGCKVLATTPLTVNDQLILTVGRGPRKTDAVVVWVGEKKGAKTEFGLDIAQNDGTFWGVQFPEETTTFAPGQAAALAASKGPAPAFPQAPAKPATPAITPQASAPTPPAAAPAPPAAAPAAATPTPPLGREPVSRPVDVLRGKEQIDEYAADVIDKAQREIRSKVREAMQLSMKEAFTAAVNSAKEDLEILSQQHAQQVLKGIEGISRAAERTTMSIEQRALSSALNTQTIMEQRFQAKMQETNAAINNVLQQAASKLEERVQAQILLVEDRWKKSLDAFVEDRIEGHLAAQTAQLMVRTQELMESQMQEFQERLRNTAEQMVQSVTKRPSHKGDKSNIV